MSQQNFPHTNIFRALFSVAASIFFIFIGVMLFKNANNYDVNPLLIKGLGVATILLFGSVGIWRLKMLLINKK